MKGTLIHISAFSMMTVMVLAGCVSNGSFSNHGIKEPRSKTDRPVIKSNRYAKPVALIARPAERDKLHSATSNKTLTLKELLLSVEQQFPLILAAIETVEIAEGELVSAEGAFDLRLKSKGEYNGAGFYKNEIGQFGFEQPAEAFGATFFSGYKIGTGDIPIWEGGSKTKTGGEFSAGVRLPLLAGRSIDARRLALWQARITQAQAEPLVLQKRIETSRKAAQAYWKWLSAGQKLKIAQRLLALAVDRKETIELSVKEGELAKIALIENRRLVVERESIVVRSERTLQQTAITLSLFWRMQDGAPRVPNAKQLPKALPTPKNPSFLIRKDGVDLALRSRPEVFVMELKLKKIELAIQKAKNDILPRLDIAAKGSQDVGDVVTDPDDKSPFEAGVYVQLDVPLQRREARGRVRTLNAKSVQVERAVQYTRDLVVAEVKDAESAIQQTWLRLAQVNENVELANKIEEAERLQLGEGESDLFRVNLREQQTASAASMQIDAITGHFRAIAVYQTSLGFPCSSTVK